MKACNRDEVRLKWLDAQNQKMRACKASDGQFDAIDAIYKKGKARSCDQADKLANELQQITASTQSIVAIDPRCIY
jgi:regulator of sigma D